ncbi:hypothetical protein D3C79_863730 [compost metagenome]
MLILSLVTAYNRAVIAARNIDDGVVVGTRLAQQQPIIAGFDKAGQMLAELPYGATLGQLGVFCELADRVCGQLPDITT